MDESRSAPAPVQRSAHEPDPLIGRLINERYKVVSVLARGGMGKVYQAEQAPLGRKVALKVLSPSYNGDNDPGFHKRFFLEASIASKLSHPNTVTIFDYGRTDDEVFYIAMELLEGRTLQRALRDEGPFTPERTMRVARQICRSLREAHGLGVIHRDLKPANVFLVEHGEDGEFVKVLDFGLVKDLDDEKENLTKTGLFMGSPKYMSPEQIRGERVDSRVDVYALGVIMYELLSGKVPFDRANSVNILMAHIHEQVPAMSEMSPSAQIPPELEQVVRQCMAKNPADRFGSMNEVLVALKQLGGARSASITISGEHRIGRPAMATIEEPVVEVSDDSFSGSGNRRTHATTTVSTKVKTPAPFAQASKPGNSSAPLFLAAIFALTGVGGFVVLANPFDKAEEVTTTPLTISAAPVAPAPVVPEKPVVDPKRKIVVALRSTPPGAMVTVGAKEYGPTPTHVVWSGEDALEGREVIFRFRRKGYQDMTISQEIHGDRLEVDAPPMEPVRRGTRAERAASEQAPAATPVKAEAAGKARDTL